MAYSLTRVLANPEAAARHLGQSDAVYTHILTGLRASATTRRDRYAAAVRLLVARLEYPYRIRRRTSDDSETLTALTTLGHDLQERLAETRAWLRAENRTMSEVFDNCRATIDTPIAQACRDAWNAAPVSTATQMNLNGFGPGNRQQTIERMEHAISYRFGARRLLPDVIVRRLLRRQGCLP